jgi:hypothetical protein
VGYLGNFQTIAQRKKKSPNRQTFAQSGHPAPPSKEITVFCWHLRSSNNLERTQRPGKGNLCTNRTWENNIIIIRYPPQLISSTGLYKWSSLLTWDYKWTYWGIFSKILKVSVFNDSNVNYYLGGNVLFSQLPTHRIARFFRTLYQHEGKYTKWP